jgi:hypothetical protein
MAKTGRPKGAKNKRTIIREAEEHLLSAQSAIAQVPDKVLNHLYVMETAMRHFFVRAQIRSKIRDLPDEAMREVDKDYQRAVAIAAKIAPYRSPTLAAIKVEGNTGDSLRDLTLEELRRDIAVELEKLGPILELEANRDLQGVANRAVESNETAEEEPETPLEPKGDGIKKNGA